jgi:hypothetical protein
MLKRRLNSVSCPWNEFSNVATLASIVWKLAKQEALGGRHSHIGDWFQCLAIIDAKIARERLLQAYDIHLKALGEAHPRVGSDLILLAKQHDTDDIDTALYYSDLAVKVFCHSAVNGTQISRPF